jgi:hypothetical protein
LRVDTALRLALLLRRTAVCAIQDLIPLLWGLTQARRAYCALLERLPLSRASAPLRNAGLARREPTPGWAPPSARFAGGAPWCGTTNKRFIVYFKNICDSTSIKKSYNYYNCFLIVSATFYNCFLVRDYTSQAEARRR